MKDSDPLLTDTGRGFSILYKGRHLYSNTDPKKNAVIKAERAILQGDTLYFLSSPLLFYGIKELISKLPPSSHIICFELSESLHSLSKKYFQDLTFNSQLISFIDSTDPASIFNKINDLGIWNFRRVKALNITGGYSLHSLEYKSILMSLDNRIQEYWKNRITLIHMGPLWIKNIFINLSKKKYSSKFSQFPEIECPILVTGAGESLENSIEFIKKQRHFFKILAVDTSISVLLENGIEPDYVIAVDAQIYNFFDFLKVKNKKIPLFFDITGYPGIPNIMNGNIYPFISDFTDTKLFERLESYKLLPTILPALGSVGVSAVHLALKLTGGNVYYTGLDFSYKIGKSHANGSPRNLSELTISNRLNPMEQPDIYYARPLIYNKDKTGLNCISDLVLNSYAELMNTSFQKNERLVDIGISGLNSGGQLINTKDISFVNKCNKGKNIENTIDTNHKTNFLKFCNNEITLLNKLYDTIFSYLSGDSTKSDLVIKLLKETDYIYIHFPDKSPEPTLDSGFLKRILISCGYYINILKKHT